MSDEYHFTRDPKTLVDAKLTRDEAEAIASYRDARERDTDRVMNLVIVLPISEELIASGDLPGAMEAQIASMASSAAVRAVRGQIGVRQQVSEHRSDHD